MPFYAFVPTSRDLLALQSEERVHAGYEDPTLGPRFVKHRIVPIAQTKYRA